MKTNFFRNNLIVTSKLLFSTRISLIKKINPIYSSQFISFCSKKEKDIVKNNENDGSNKNTAEEETVNITYKYLVDGTTVNVKAKIGENILKTAHHFEIDLEGACDCSLACSTCHVILDQKLFDSIPKSEELEDDLLDLAYGLTHTSRLGCQIKITKDFEGTVINIPSYTKNLYVDGHKPKPH